MTVVFTDAFTVGADIDIDAYPSGSPDYTYVRGSGTNIRVIASTDRVTIVAANASVDAKISDAAVPTGDQQITGSCVSGAGGDGAYLLVRANTNQYYNSYIDTSAANEVKIYRRDNSTTTTLLASVDRGLGTGTHTHRLRATGTGATVDLEFQANATTVLTYSDTSGSRITSGSPGLGGYSFSGSTVHVDDLSVDDLAGAGGVAGPLVGGRLVCGGLLRGRLVRAA